MNEQEANLKFRQADAFFRAGEYAQALSVLESLNSTFPNNRSVLFPAALCLEKLGRFDQADAVCAALAQQADPRAEGLRAQIQQARAAQTGDMPLLMGGMDDILGPSPRKKPVVVQQSSVDWQRIAIIGGVVLAVLGVAALGYTAVQKGWISRGKSMEDIQTEMIAFWQNAESFRTDLQVSGQVAQQGMNLGISGGGNLEFMEEAEKPMFRLTGAVSVSGMPIPMDVTFEMVNDSTAMFYQFSMMGQQMVMKMPVPPSGSSNSMSPEEAMAKLKEEDVKLVRGQQLDGIDAYTFEFTPKPGSSAAQALSQTGQEAGKVRFQVTQDYSSGMRLEVLDKSDAPKLTLTAKNIQVNPKFEAKDFAYKPPASAKVVDLSDPNALRGLMGGFPGFGG